MKKKINSKINNNIKKSKSTHFIDRNILIKKIDYYYTNAIARSSKVMSDCRQISKKLSYNGIERLIK